MNERIGKPLPRVDAPQKSGGYARYIADMEFEGMLNAKTLRSTRARAKILEIRTPDIPEGFFIVDKTDVPGANRVKMLDDDQPFFADGVVNYIGEPILLVVGPDRERVASLVSEIEVRYEDLPPVFTIEDSEKSTQRPIYGDDNCFARYEIQKGNADDGFRGAVRTIEHEYRTGYQEHLYLEPQGVVGVYENERIAVYGSIQCPYYVKTALVHGFGWDEKRIRVIQVTTGGAFGGKEDYPSIIAGHVAFAAVKTGKPVRLVFDRSEDIQVTTKRHPSIINIRTGLDEQNNIVAVDVNIRFDGGAYAGLSSVVLQRAMFAATGVYNHQNVKVRGKVVATNNVPSGAMRGFGAPQAFFAVEMHMQSIAEQLGEDPLHFKIKHLLKKGDSTITNGLLRDDVKLPEMIDLVLKMSDYEKRTEQHSHRDDGNPRGIGIALFYHGCGFTGSGERDKIRAVVKLKKLPDCKVQILVSNVDMGQGPLTTLRKIVGESLNIPIQDILYETPDTELVPDSGPTVASRTIMIVGNLLKDAAEELGKRWDEGPVVEVRREYRQPDHMCWDQESFKGDAYPVYSWGTSVVEVEVDPVTFVVTVKNIWSVYDVGTPIDDGIIQGQIEGGIAQGLGYATIEVLCGQRGSLMQHSMTDYIIPTSLDLPRAESKLIDNYYEYGPYGAKCAGELPFVGAAPALAAAVQNALKVRIGRLPVTPEYLLEVVESENSICTKQ
jgi:CO/xanthine dehydrogenase Mo-binding subunit